ncbi:hypothetical protein HK097_004906 [Rhizophlyctis rosea]|uniref:Exportin-5 C-terminal domain-containing protein n=1 Tax=Rhizophlyctis rosea TaxID=64517 RepID=A0AAD5SH48_9FUNG|nr:hypothetical protein HK097_004906 [Rhizophlyctis rosea]
MLHSIWNPLLWQQYPRELVKALEITAQERAISPGMFNNIPGMDTSEDGAAEPATILDDEILALKRYFAHTRDPCYQLVNLFTYLGRDFYASPNIKQNLILTLFAGIEHMENRHLKRFIPVVMQPLMLQCPPDLHRTFLYDMLPFFLNFIVARLEKDWKSVAEKGSVMTEEDEGDGEDVSDEIVAERLLRDATRKVADLYGVIFQTPLPEKSSKDDIKNPTAPALTHQDLVVFLVSSDIGATFLKILLYLITVKDTTTSNKILKLCSKIAPILGHTPALQAWFGKDVLMKALEALHDGYLEACHVEAVALIAQIYITVRPTSRISYETMLNIPGMDVRALDDFETQLGQKSTLKEQTAVVKLFLNNIRGLAVSQWGKQKESFILNQTEKALLTKPAADSHASDVLENEHGDAGIGALFD